MSEQTTILANPNTGRKIEVAARDAADWKAQGWVDPAELADKGDAEGEAEGAEADAPATKTTRGGTKK